MAADQERAQRIQRLKDERPGLTWRAIAEGVGVTERAAAEWGRTGGITFMNVTKLARVLSEHGPRVEPDYIWLGRALTDALPRSEPASVEERLDRIEAQLARVLEVLGATQIDEDERDLLDATAELLDRHAPPTQTRPAADQRRRTA